MTRPLTPGCLLVDASDAGLLLWVFREGVLAAGTRRTLPPGASRLLAAIEQAALAARVSIVGTVAVQPAPGPAPSTVMVEQAAEVLNVSTSYARRLCRTGALTAWRHGSRWNIDADSVAGYALARRVAA